MGKKLKKNVPLLRFPEFKGEWETKSIQSLLDENIIVEHLDGNHGELYPRSDEFSYEGVPYISANDLDGQSVNLNNSKKLPVERARLFKKGIARSGDVIFAHNATVGPTGILKTELEFVILSTTVTYYRCELSQLNNRFLLHSFNTSYFVRQFSRVMSQSTRNQVPITTQRKFYLHLPSIAEQEKIASFLGAIDTRLNQLRRKHELLQTYKRGIMQKLFSQKLRFTQPNGSPFPDWEEKKLGDIADTNKSHSFTGGPFGSDLKSSDYTQEGIRVIQLQNIGDGYFVNDYQIFTSEDKADQLINCNIYPNDILISKMGDPVARACIVPNYHKRYLMCSDGIRLVVNNDLFNTYFIYSVLNAPTFRKSAESASSGSTRKRIGLTNLRILKISCPILEEQEKIVNFLTAIDRKIETLSRQIEQTEQFKKGLLQKMFV